MNQGEKMTILEKVSALLKNRQFLSIATANKTGEPHSAPKIFLKIEGRHLYLVDYAIAKTVENLKVNPRASMSFMDMENLEGYRLTGDVELVRDGRIFGQLSKELDQKLIRLSADRVIEGMRTGKRHQHFELEFTKKVIFLNVKIEEIVRIGSQGELFKEKQ